MRTVPKIYWLVGLSVLVSLLYSFWFKITPVVDAQAYDQIAVNLLAGHGFRENPTLDFNFDHAMLRAGPGYEFFLAFIYWIFGHTYAVVWFIQALLHGATVWLVYRAAKQIWPEETSEVQEWIALSAAGMIAFHPDLIEISAMLMTETLYVFIVSVLVYLFVTLQRKITWLKVGWLGLWLGLGILVRPTLLLFAPVVLVLFLFQKKWLESAVFVAMVGLVLAPWVIRNYSLYHQFILTTLIGDFNIWIGNTLSADGGQIAGGFNPVTTYVDQNGLTGLGNEAKKMFREFIFTYPQEFIKLTAIRTVRYFSLIRPMGFWFYDHGLSQIIFVIASGLSIAGLFVSGLAGIILAWWRREQKWYLLALTVTAPIPLLVTVVQSRYRFQIYPFLALFGAYAVVKLWKKASVAKMAWVMAAIILGVFTLIDIMLSWSLVAARLTDLI